MLFLSVGQRKFVLVAEKGLFCLLILKQQTNMKNLFFISFLFLVSCTKEPIEQPTQTDVETFELTGKAQEINAAIWGQTLDSRQAGGNYISFGDPMQFQDNTTATGEVRAFEVERASEYKTDDTDQMQGEGVAYYGGSYMVTVIEPTNIHRMLVRCYRDGQMLSGFWYDF